MFHVNANLTEVSMYKCLEAAGCERVVIPTKYYFSLIKKGSKEINKVWEARLLLAAPHLIKAGYKCLAYEEGASLLNKVDWDRVPSQLFVDWVLGIDCLVQTEEGLLLGVDCTTSTDPDVIKTKKQELIKMQPLLAHLGIDAVVVCRVQFNEYGFAALTQTKQRRLIKGVTKLLNKDLSSKWLHSWVLNLTE